MTVQLHLSNSGLTATIDERHAAALQAIIWTAERVKNGKRSASFSAAMNADRQGMFTWA